MSDPRVADTHGGSAFGCVLGAILVARLPVLLAPALTVDEAVNHGDE